MPHALIYIRKSVVRTGADAISPERQLALCRAEVARHPELELTDADIYIDAEGHSSGRTEARLAWQALRRRRGEIAAALDREASGLERILTRLVHFTALSTSADPDVLSGMARAVFTSVQIRGPALISATPQPWCAPFF